MSKETANEERRNLSAEKLLDQGCLYQSDGRTEEAIKSYEQALETAGKANRNDIKAKALQCLGNVFSSISQYMKAVEYYKKARDGLPDLDGEVTEIDAYQWLGNDRLQAGQFEESINYYEEAAKLALQLGDKILGKTRAYMANQTIGDIQCGAGYYEKAKIYYEKAVKIAEDNDKRPEIASSSLSFALACSKESDYSNAIKWYERALEISRIELNDQMLLKKTLAGLAITWFRLGNSKKAIDYLQEAVSCDEKETKLSGEHDAAIAEEQIHLREVNSSQSSVSDDWVNDQISKVYDPTIKEGLPSKDLILLKTYFTRFSQSPANIYTHLRSSKEPLTNNIRKSMTETVKNLAYEHLLGLIDDKPDETESDEKFSSGRDRKILNFVKDDVSKNSSTKIPATLFKFLSSYIASIGQIKCGSVRGTCFLVRGNLVITAHHVYMDINSEREKPGNQGIPIEVNFYYKDIEHMEYVLTVEVDEQLDPNLESSNLDYKFLRLKDNEGLSDRVQLGALVRCCPFQDRVIIIGHPVGEEMCQETCVAIGNHSWLGKLGERKACLGLHMTNNELLNQQKEHQNHLPYDTSLFSGTSGSPVFDISGNIVAMHTQGYTLKVKEGECSLMEFGVPFGAICEDMRKRYNVKDVEQIFPNGDLADNEAPMDEDF